MFLFCETSSLSSNFSFLDCKRFARILHHNLWKIHPNFPQVFVRFNALLLIPILTQWPMTILGHTYRSRRVTVRKNLKTQIRPSKDRKKYIKIHASLWNWKKADRIEAGFRLNNRPKRAENTPGWHQARSYHRFRDIELRFKEPHRLNDSSCLL